MIGKREAYLAVGALMSLLAVPSGAQAHVFGAGGAGFVEGFAHPISGLDHVLAMLAVGLWAGQRGGRATWLIPASFLAAMFGGGLAGLSGLWLPLPEMGIAASVILLGALVAGRSRLRLTASIAVVGTFALFHGYAHGAEVPDAAAPALYSLGFLAATALLHLAGIGLAVAARNHLQSAAPMRLGGAAISALGVLLLVGT